jgi:UDP-GlcNAc:undecaprenyl-phosphate/decaprenyl-phosphate GlcNAc-1-phosphate transferase
MFGVYDRYLAAFLTALVVTYLLTPFVRAAACRFGIVDLPNERRPHKHATARGGGLAVVVGVYAACLLALAFPAGTRAGGFDLHWWLSFLPASLILLAVGLVDDIRGLGPWKKLAGQVVAASWICFSGTHFGKLFGIELPPILDGILVVVWIVAVINAYNLIDGLDGLASGLAIISATGLCGILVFGDLPGVTLVLVALVGACLAFLRYNFHPATIFLGDTGSMFLGLVLGVISLQTFTKNTFFLSMTIPMLVLGVPIYDALLAIWRRSVRRFVSGHEPGEAARRPGIMTADVEHLHHRLLKAGLSTRRVATVLCIMNGALAVLGLLIMTFQSHASGIFLLALLAVVYVLLRHMAVIELRETGRVLLTGLRRPTHALLKSLAYPFWDMFCLAGALLVAMRLFDPPGTGFWHSWFLDLPVWVTPTFSLLAISRTYLTVWTRARVLDVLMLLFMLQAGLVVSLGIALLIDPSNVTNSLLRALVIGALGHSAMISLRVFYRCMEEFVLYLKLKIDPNTDLERVVLYGAGGRCQLFLKERGFNNSSSYDGRAIVGLLDDEPSLHAQWVYGFPVLGGIKELPYLIKQHRLTGIIITAALPPGAREAIQKLALKHGLRLSEWSFGERKLDNRTPQQFPAPAGEQAPAPPTAAAPESTAPGPGYKPGVSESGA